MLRRLFAEVELEKAVLKGLAGETSRLGRTLCWRGSFDRDAVGERGDGVGPGGAGQIRVSMPAPGRHDGGFGSSVGGLASLVRQEAPEGEPVRVSPAPVVRLDCQS